MCGNDMWDADGGGETCENEKALFRGITESVSICTSMGDTKLNPHSFFFLKI